MAFGGLIAWRL